MKAVFEKKSSTPPGRAMELPQNLSDGMIKYPACRRSGKPGNVVVGMYRYLFDMSRNAENCGPAVFRHYRRNGD
jgi:hypothetical protein